MRMILIKITWKITMTMRDLRFSIIAMLASAVPFDGFAADEMSSGGRGQLLMPWPNRVRDGAYSFDGRDLQLALTEPRRSNASHGLARWAAWRAVISPRAI